MFESWDLNAKKSSKGLFLFFFYTFFVFFLRAYEKRQIKKKRKKIDLTVKRQALKTIEFGCFEPKNSFIINS